jgi:hypothetical protein
VSNGGGVTEACENRKQRNQVPVLATMRIVGPVVIVRPVATAGTAGKNSADGFAGLALQQAG